jgi:hypothetical protein
MSSDLCQLLWRHKTSGTGIERALRRVERRDGGMGLLRQARQRACGGMLLQRRGRHLHAVGDLRRRPLSAPAPPQSGEVSRGPGRLGPTRVGFRVGRMATRPRPGPPRDCGRSARAARNPPTRSAPRCCRCRCRCCRRRQGAPWAVVSLPRPSQSRGRWEKPRGVGASGGRQWRLQGRRWRRGVGGRAW